MIRVATIFSFLAAVALLATAGAWWRVAHHGQPELGARRLRIAAGATAVSFWLLCVALFARTFELLD